MLVDSNVLVYSLNSSSPKCKPARRFLQISSGEFWIAQQNVIEVIRIITHPKFPTPMSASQAVGEVREIIEAGRVIYPIYETLDLAMELIKKHQLVGTRVFDAYLAATMLSNGIETIATDNIYDFRIFSQIKIINPFSLN